jgi:hypothetical protein
MGFETFGNMNIHDTPYSHQPQDDGFNFPDVDPTQNFASNGGIFAAFDGHDQSDHFHSRGSGGQGSLKFPSNSNMMSTNHTNNYMAQFQAYPQQHYSKDSRVSCPMALQNHSTLDFQKPASETKYKSGEAVNKSAFLKQLESRLEAKNSDVQLSDIIGHVLEVAKDQKGSRFIQDVYCIASDADKQSLFDEIKDQYKDLILDKFANYVIQKIFEHGLEEHIDYLVMKIKGSMMSLSMDDHGCRVVQKMLENLKNSSRIELIVELHDNVEKLIFNKNGNHVIQKVIEFVPEKYLGFIIEEVEESIYAFCKHKYGCRVVGKLIEFCKTEEVDAIVDEIIPNIQELTFDASGNYVAQALIMHGKTSYKKRVISVYKKDLLKFSTQKYSSNVMEACFKYCSNAQRRELVKELLKSTKSGSNSLEKMFKDRFANYVIQKMLEKMDKTDRDTIITKILEISKKEKKLNSSANHVLKIIKDKYL